jgi:hypothetical protein
MVTKHAEVGRLHWMKRFGAICMTGPRSRLFPPSGNPHQTCRRFLPPELVTRMPNRVTSRSLQVTCPVV